MHETELIDRRREGELAEPRQLPLREIPASIEINQPALVRASQHRLVIPLLSRKARGEHP
jgi:hypothetical protein